MINKKIFIVNILYIISFEDLHIEYDNIWYWDHNYMCNFKFYFIDPVLKSLNKTLFYHFVDFQ